MKICIPIQAKAQREALKMLGKIKGQADVAEIWLDHIKDLNISELLKNSPMPVLCVCKKPIDKGLFKGTYNEMVKMLVEAVKYGVEYIDIPFSIPEKLSKKCVQLPAQVIVSHHDFKKTPSIKKLHQMALDMKKRGADIVKIAVMAKTLNDTFGIISLAQTLKEEGIPHILIAMGKRGTLSRVLTPMLGGTMMFAPLSSKNSSASGQLTVSELRKAWGMFK